MELLSMALRCSLMFEFLTSIVFVLCSICDRNFACKTRRRWSRCWCLRRPGRRDGPSTRSYIARSFAAPSRWAVAVVKTAVSHTLSRSCVKDRASKRLPSVTTGCDGNVATPGVNSRMESRSYRAPPPSTRRSCANITIAEDDAATAKALFTHMGALRSRRRARRTP